MTILSQNSDFVKAPVFCDTCKDIVATVEVHRDTPLHQVSEILDILLDAHYRREHNKERTNGNT